VPVRAKFLYRASAGDFNNIAPSAINLASSSEISIHQPLRGLV